MKLSARSQLTPPLVADVDHPAIRCSNLFHPPQQISDLPSNLPMNTVGSGVGGYQQ